jgi:hypothetical protein
MGAPNFMEDFAPHPLSVIFYNPESSTPESLAETLKKLAANDTLYEEHMAWRKMTLSSLSPGFQRMVEYGRRTPNPECKLCQKVAEMRYGKEIESRTVSFKS